MSQTICKCADELTKLITYSLYCDACISKPSRRLTEKGLHILSMRNYLSQALTCGHYQKLLRICYIVINWRLCICCDHANKNPFQHFIMPSLCPFHVCSCCVSACLYYNMLYQQAQRAAVIKCSCHLFCTSTNNSASPSFTSMEVYIVASYNYLCSYPFTSYANIEILQINITSNICCEDYICVMFICVQHVTPINFSCH